MLQLSSGRVLREIRVSNCEGHQFNLLDIRPHDVPLPVLAHQLAQINRFCGAIKHPFSVASHSVLVSLLLPDDLQFDGLLHDLTEACGLGDVISPIKVELPDYKALEGHVRTQLAQIFGFSLVEPAMVKVADRRSRALEAHYLRGEHMENPPTVFERELAHMMIIPELHWEESSRLFLDHYRSCQEARNLIQ